MTNETKQPANKAFEVHSVYAQSSIVDSQSKTKYICLKRTAKMVTFQKFQYPNSEKITRMIQSYNGVEYISLGSYSMAPSISAKNITD